MLLDYPRQAPVGDHQKQNNYDYNFVKRWRLHHDEQFDVAFWMRGKPDRVALIMAPWEPDTSANVLLMVRLTCIAERYSNISVLSEAWGLPEGQQRRASPSVTTSAEPSASPQHITGPKTVSSIKGAGLACWSETTRDG